MDKSSQWGRFPDLEEGARRTAVRTAKTVGGVGGFMGLAAVGALAAAGPARAISFCPNSHGKIQLNNPYTTGPNWTCTRYQSGQKHTKSVWTFLAQPGGADNGACVGLTTGTSQWRHTSDATGLGQYHCANGFVSVGCGPCSGGTGYPFEHNDGDQGAYTNYGGRWGTF
jgi:hypothetical protein